jgi:hypothetical protein
MKPISTTIWLGLLLVVLTACAVATPQANTTAAQSSAPEPALPTTTEITDNAPVEQPQNASKVDDNPKVDTNLQVDTNPEVDTNQQVGPSQEVVDTNLPAETGPTAEQLRILANLPDNGPAPELHNDIFLNSETLRLADLHGKVVIVDFWTYG